MTFAMAIVLAQAVLLLGSALILMRIVFDLRRLGLVMRDQYSRMVTVEFRREGGRYTSAACDASLPDSALEPLGPDTHRIEPGGSADKKRRRRSEAAATSPSCGSLP
jgi:hypothetical protein